MDPVFNDMQGIYACPSIIVFLREILLPLNLKFYLKETNIKVPELHKVTNFGKCTSHLWCMPTRSYMKGIFA